MEIQKILEDDREITAIWTSETGGYIVGEPQGYGEGCTKILAYGEPGPGAMMPWFAVYEDETLIARVPAHRCEAVVYKAA